MAKKPLPKGKDLLKLLESKTQTEIAKEYGTTQGNVSKHAARAGYTGNPNAKGKRNTAPSWETLKADQDKGMSQGQLAKKYGIGQSEVGRILRGERGSTNTKGRGCTCSPAEKLMNRHRPNCPG